MLGTGYLAGPSAGMGDLRHELEEQVGCERLDQLLGKAPLVR